MPILRIRDSLYRSYIIFIYDEDGVKIKAYLKNKSTVDIDEHLKSDAFVIPMGTKSCCLVINKPHESFESTLVHECVHVAYRILSESGMELTDASEEAYAYFIEWLFNECLTRRNKLIARAKQVGESINTTPA